MICPLEQMNTMISWIPIMNKPLAIMILLSAAVFCSTSVSAAVEPAAVDPVAVALPAPRTPVPGPAPRINGPTIFGVRPASPFLYTIPATGERPVTFAATGLPAGLTLDNPKCNDFATK